MTQLTDEEVERVAIGGAHVVHCPRSNLKLASGRCPVDALKAAGVNVALGTDGAASNNSLDLFDEMRSAALLRTSLTGDATAAPAADMLEMATPRGCARARSGGRDRFGGDRQAGGSARRRPRRASACSRCTTRPRSSCTGRPAGTSATYGWAAAASTRPGASPRSTWNASWRGLGSGPGGWSNDRARQRRPRGDREVRGAGTSVVGPGRRLQAAARHQRRAGRVPRGALQPGRRACCGRGLRGWHSDGEPGGPGRGGDRHRHGGESAGRGAVACHRIRTGPRHTVRADLSGVVCARRTGGVCRRDVPGDARTRARHHV